MAAQLLQIAGCSWSRARGSGTRLAAVTTTAVLSVQYLIETCMPRAAERTGGGAGIYHVMFAFFGRDNEHSYCL